MDAHRVCCYQDKIIRKKKLALKKTKSSKVHDRDYIDNYAADDLDMGILLYASNPWEQSMYANDYYVEDMVQEAT